VAPVVVAQVATVAPVVVAQVATVAPVVVAQVAADLPQSPRGTKHSPSNPIEPA
jgi:hypothetical protein